MGKHDCYAPGDHEEALLRGTGLVELLQHVDGQDVRVGVLRRWNNGAFHLEIDDTIYDPLGPLICELVGPGRHSPKQKEDEEL